MWGRRAEAQERFLCAIVCELVDEGSLASDALDRIRGHYAGEAALLSKGREKAVQERVSRLAAEFHHFVSLKLH
jgi:hypothetical protein